MENFLIYIVKVALSTAVFYLAYLVLFKNQKHFVFNRIYLVSSLILSHLIPLITFTTVRTIQELPLIPNVHFNAPPETTGFPLADSTQTIGLNYLMMIYVAGMIGFLTYLIIGHIKAINIVQSATKKDLFGAEICITTKDVHPFSFFNKIVLSEYSVQHPDVGIIIDHERIHVQEKHTIDILITELLFLTQWFNPLAWLLRDAVKNNLEYKTDNEIIKTHNPQAYQLAMVALADKTEIAPFLTALDGSQLKNRIIMMKTKSTNKYSLVKQLLLIPVLATLILGLSTKEVRTEILPTNDQKESIISDKEGKIIKGTITNNKGKALSAVSILIKDKKTGTNSNKNGEFTIDIGDNQATLLFIAQGYKKEEIKVSNQDVVDVILQKLPESVTVNRVMNAPQKPYKVIGQVRNQKGEELPGTSVIVKGKKIGTITNIDGHFQLGLDDNNETLQFSVGNHETKEVKLKGIKELDVIDVVLKEISATDDPKTKSGKEESSNNVKLNAKDPLYVLDGKIIEDMNKVEPSNIESVSFLKGASATDLYGKKGKNGVVLITTKAPQSPTNPTKPVKPQQIPATEGKPETSLSVKAVSSIAKSSGKEPVKIAIEGSESSHIKKNLDLKNVLTIVDGKEYKKDPNNIPPKEIKSITVLKDKTAISKYGDKGKNGVLLVTTHSGNHNK